MYFEINLLESLSLDAQSEYALRSVDVHTCVLTAHIYRSLRLKQNLVT